jgi:translation initiation factor eIF-2B subunit alpha/methylthioribose-1-phosphate isomerase
LFFAIEWFLENYAAPEKPTALANRYIEDLVSRCKKIGEHGVALLADGSHVLTHCNAGALATVDWGTALAPLRVAHRRGKRLFVYVSETRPRLQGALTSWELLNEGIAHTLIVDAAAGYYMRKGKVDLVLVGADRIARNGDFANKIGTYEKAVLAKENNVRFYVAAPFSTIDFSLREGAAIRIEERASAEVLGIGRFARGTPAENPAFDVTPAKYVTGYITEDGIFSATELKNLR